MSLLKTLRTPRIGGIALFDLTTAFIGVFLVLWFLFPRVDKKKLVAITLVITLPIGIVVHAMFHIPTMLNYYLGISKKPQQ